MNIPANPLLVPTSTPTQLGYVPSGIAGTVFVPSQVTIGRSTTGGWEAGGFGNAGRPDSLQLLTVNLTNRDATMPAKLSFDVSDVYAIISGNSNAPRNMFFRLTEVSVCVDSVEKKAMILMSQTYDEAP